MDLQIHSSYITAYMKAVENTESPRLFHLWCSVNTVAAALGRRCFVPLGIVGKVFPNHFILLVGPPAVRKSSALGVAKRLVKESTNVRFAPTDTGGQRQGLIRAMESNNNAEELAELANAALNDPFLQDDKTKEIAEDVKAKALASEDKHVLAAYWSELSGAMGQANHSLMDFMVQTYDGDDYNYMTKNGEMEIPKTLLNILAATTPTSLNITMPPSAEGHGFLSRFILVHGDQNYQNVVWPEAPDAALVARIKESLNDINQNLHGAFAITPDAKSYAETLYNIQLEITDARFQHYKARRFTHLIKLALVLAASRMSTEIVKDDFVIAHQLLRVTEESMPDALGQFGLSPIAQLKQSIVVYLRQIAGPVAVDAIKAVMAHDARPTDITDAIEDLRISGTVAIIQKTDGTVLVTAKRVKGRNEDQSVLNALIEKPKEKGKLQ